MLPFVLFLFLIFPAALLVVVQSAGELPGVSFPSGGTGFNPGDPCMVVSPPCISEADRYSLEALQSIHQMMDDDKDGGIEVEESVEFIIEDMKQQQTNKHSHLHREDQHITVEELWKGWKSSEVHNWTQDDVIRWLREFVELPQYEKNFKDFKVNGNTLPRIAANEPSFLSGQLRVQDQRDKQKLNIKALDVVLFGPPSRPPHNYMKDLLLMVSVVMGVGGCWFAQVQNKSSKIHINKMMKDLESLQRAEQSLLDMQEQLERAQEEKRNVAEEKQNLEEKMRDEIIGAQEEAHRLQELRQGAVSELSRLRYAEEELVQVRGALRQAEKDMHATWTASEVLQQWLQLTHEVEVQYYNVKKHSAELQLATAKEEAEKIKKKRSSVFGTLHVAHSSSLDQVDHKILEAKNALSDVTACLRERLHRWQQIECICGFPIIRNPGLTNLTALLYSESLAAGFPRVPQPSHLWHSSLHGSIEDLLEESSAAMLSQIPVAGVPLKSSPRPRTSTIRRSRRHGVTQPPTTLISADPDLLIPIRTPYPCFDEDDGVFRKTVKKQDSQERFSDSDHSTSPPHSKMYPCSPTDGSRRKLYRDETEPLVERSLTKPATKEAEADVESPVRKISLEELEAPVDVSCRKMVKDKAPDCSLENPSMMMSKDGSLIEASFRRRSRGGSESAPDFVIRKVSASEFDAEFPPCKIEIIEDVTDNLSRSLPKDRGEFPLEVRKIVWDEVEASELGQKKLSRAMMGASVDTASRKLLDGSEGPFDLVARRITRDSMGMSLDGSPCWQLDCSVRGTAKDKMAEVPIIPSRKISKEGYFADTFSAQAVPREETEQQMHHTSSPEKLELGSEASISRRQCKAECDVPLRRRAPRLSRDERLTQENNPLDSPIEAYRHQVVRDESEESESNLAPCESEQPDLTATSDVPWKPSADIFALGPLSRLVYDGILEKSCNSMAATPTSLSASPPNIPQSFPKIQAVSEPPVAPARGIDQSSPSTAEAKDDRNRDKEKSKKSLKLKNLFKKKNEAMTEKVQSGLQKL
ncbi:stromal interaction molecule 2-like isoform X1 [Hippocampus zosterae]|uniref:stromal interaction molecule 2-like isoform X1 n=1 Tax=Hippocampus zosterae TaxID=109293 RepID=UPI00223C973B|nr:stromal interaction molecule 2-like isoform X1 [Hippocampus zosterae]